MIDLFLLVVPITASYIGYGVLLALFAVLLFKVVGINISRKYFLFTLFGFGFVIFDMNLCRKLVDNMISAGYAPIWKFKRFAVGIALPNRVRLLAYKLFPSLKPVTQPLNFD